MSGRVFRNVGVVFAGEVVAKALEFGFILYAASALGVSDFGLLSSALAFTALFSFLTDMGLYQLAVREIAKDRKKAAEYVADIGGLKAALNGGVYVIMAAASYLLGYPAAFSALVLIIGASMVLESYNYMFNSVFQAYERLDYSAYGRMISAVALLVGALASERLGLGVGGFALAYVLSRGACAAWGLAITGSRFIRLTIRFRWARWKTLLGESWPYGLTLVFTNIFLSADIVVIAYFLGSAQAGIYAAASKLMLACTFILAAYNQAVYPVLSSLHDRRAQFNRTLGFYLRGMLFIGAPMVILATTLSKDIIGAIYPEAYQASSPLLPVLASSMFIAFISSPFHRALDATGRQKSLFKAVLAGTLLNVTLNMAFVPGHGIRVAAYAALAGQLIFLAAPAMECMRAGLRPSVGLKSLVSLAVSASAMMIVLLLTSDMGFIPRLLAGSLTYVTAYALMGGMDGLIRIGDD